ncbi:transglycosylase domain-containing protein [Weissella viridescens]|uniref:transglycosylase domain-containing protein n=1 Tax=Weissella viridescens TaxID=1629 RepID=UPI001D069240|nr:transglycosylase domain-containing protein [Weissella viridescens]MCB6839540.1 transglycosylase domain-containing protein [Weissella viridescens]MCB6846271.1 transglycosylase domain-containing protein [Weissella viridescens]
MSDESSRVSRQDPKKNPNSRSQRQKKTNNSKHYWRNGIITVAVVGVLGVTVGAGMFTYYASSAPKITDSALRGTSQTQLLDSSGKVFYTTGNQTREVAKESEIPDSLKEAVVSIEDKRFYKHHGVDPRRILGATFANFTGSSLGLQGGSTLTQQLVKLTVFSTSSADQTLKRKAQEAYLAVNLEKKYSKDQILTLYMNKVYMGNGVYGMKTAAEYYFGKPLDKLSTPQIALIAGLPQSPSGYDPYTNPKGAKTRRDTVLTAMKENNVISAKQLEEYKKVPLSSGLQIDHPDSEKSAESAKISDAYISSTLSELQKMGYDPTKDGLKVHTNLNLDVQKKAYEIANGDAEVQWPSDDLQLAMTVANPKNGKVIAQIGGRKNDTTFGLNRAQQTTRSSGSTAKPLVDYGPAVEHLNWPTYRALNDTPYTYPGTNTKVYDFDHKFDGPMTMRHAVAQSRNIPAIRAYEAVGSKDAADFMTKLGIKTKAENLVPSNAIGIDVSTEQEAAAYSAFENGGTYYKPYYVSSISEQNGDVKDIKPVGQRAMKTSTAFLLTSMMKSVVTDSYANIVNTPEYAQAGKTGTTGYADDAKVPDGAASDTWFTGYTKTATISSWTGYDEPNTPGHYLASGDDQMLALQSYKALMNYIMTSGVIDADGSDWTAPSSVKEVNKYGKQEFEVRGASFKDPGLAKLQAQDDGKQSSSNSIGNSSSSTILNPDTRDAIRGESSSSRQTESSSQQTITNDGQATPATSSSAASVGQPASSSSVTVNEQQSSAPTNNGSSGTATQ